MTFTADLGDQGPTTIIVMTFDFNADVYLKRASDNAKTSIVNAVRGPRMQGIPAIVASGFGEYCLFLCPNSPDD